MQQGSNGPTRGNGAGVRAPLNPAAIAPRWQVYAANRYSSSPKGRWLARGVDILLHQYPSLRVAFLDSYTGAQGPQQYSVLIRGQVGTPASDPEATLELYR